MGFEWDAGNLEKSYEKHGITPKESEKLFVDENVLLIDDIKHSQKEKRFIAIGEIGGGIVLFSAFVIRGNRVRIISVRKANKKERIEYDKT